MLKKSFIIIIVAILAVFWTQNVTRAQFDFGVSADNFFIELIPTDSPGPNQSVSARLSGFSFDIDRSQITWTHNGSVRARGAGVKDYNFTTGAIGSRERLNVSAIDANGVRHETSLSFVVADIDLLWQAETSVPYWYKGKALVSVKSAVVVSAFPNLISGGRKISSSNLIYRWSLDDDFKQNQSGAGKNTFRFTAGFSSGLAHSVHLEVSDISESVTAKKTININVVNPSVSVYEEDALSGSKTAFAFGGRADASLFAGDKKTFNAYPFFFSLAQGRENVEYLWSVNGEPAKTGEPKNALLIEASADASGRSSVSVLVKNIANILQEVSQNFSINVF